MPDLKDQIRTYYEATTEPVDVHDVVVESGTVLVGPFPDAAQRRAMDTNPDEARRHRDSTARKWLIGGGIAAASLLIAGTALVFDGTDPAVAPDSAAAPPTTLEAGTTAPMPPPEPVNVVSASYAAFNRGDVSAWLAHYAEDAIVSGIRRGEAEDRYAALFAANAQRNVESCVAGELSADGLATVDCVHVETNEFQGAGGFAPVVSMTHIIDNAGLITSSSIVVSDYQALTRYNTLFWLWLEEHHADVYTEIQPDLEGRGDDPGTGSKYPQTAEAMQRVLPLVDDFVAQSDAYPVTE